MEALKKFDLEMAHLEKLYWGTMYAYDQVERKITNDIEFNLLSPKSPIARTLPPGISGYHRFNAITRTVEGIRQELKGEFPRHLRETLFVRAISTLEVFLIDVVREIFLARKDLFHRDELVELSYAQLLSFESVSEIATHLINKECRKLQNEGFKKLTGYFRQRLGIDLARFPDGLDKITEYHERRHLLVHRLGYTDAIYRKHYRVKHERITVGSSYFRRCIGTIRTFANFVAAEAREIVEKDTGVGNIYPPTGIVTVKIQVLSPKGADPIELNHSFMFGEQLIAVKDILYSHTEDTGGIHALDLRGNYKHIDGYIVHLKRFERNNENALRILDIKYARRIGRKKKLPYDFVQIIEKVLPSQPWPADIHIRIAEKFGVTDAQASHAIKRIQLKLPDEVMKKIEEELPQEPWPVGIHKDIAVKFGLTHKQVHEALRRIRSRSSANQFGENTRANFADSTGNVEDPTKD